jgi:5-methylcytosine-specific restriction endonuclease McrA
MIPWTKALSLVFRGKVQVFEYYDGVEIRSAREVHALPSVVLLKHTFAPYGREVGLNKRNLLVRDNYECQYCGKTLSDSSATVDHVIPSCKGGAHSWENVVAACRRCNNVKANKTLEQANLMLRKQPFKPSRRLLLRQRAAKLGYAAWLPYFGGA